MTLLSYGQPHGQSPILSFFLYDPPTSGGSMAALAILAKGSHEGMLILDGANRDPVVTGEEVRRDVSAIEVQVVGVDVVIVAMRR